MKSIQFTIGDRVNISTHGSNPGTVVGFMGKRVIVQIDTEPGSRLCLPENVSLIVG